MNAYASGGAGPGVGAGPGAGGGQGQRGVRGNGQVLVLRPQVKAVGKDGLRCESHSAGESTSRSNVTHSGTSYSRELAHRGCAQRSRAWGLEADPAGLNPCSSAAVCESLGDPLACGPGGITSLPRKPELILT